MGLPDDLHDIGRTPESLGGFVDRVPESVALARSLEVARRRMDEDEIDLSRLQHVLVFHGQGGVGKTELSKQLALWLASHAGAPTRWGPAPATHVNAIARWDLSRSHGDIDPLPLLLELRRALGQIRREWPAFDLAFTAYLKALRSGEEFTLTTPQRGATLTTSDVLTALMADAAAAADVAGASGLATTTVGIGRTVLAAARANRRARRTMEEYAGLEALLVECARLPSSDEDASAVAAKIAYLFSREVSRMPHTERPLVVVFVDHMERLQVPGRRPGETTLNRLVGALPYCLFVVTGRRSLRWHEPGLHHLERRGTATWPNLHPEVSPDVEPRQHRVGNLHRDDAEDFLRRAFDNAGVTVVDGLVEELAGSTDGWPLHLTTIVSVAIDRAQPGRPLTKAELGGPLPDLVNRIFEDLPADEADAMRAACLLPYFDLEFAAAAGAVPVGAVERLVHRSIVQRSTDSLYPYRIHDELRDIVRNAGAEADRGWARSDWVAHAHHALDEAQRRFDLAMASRQDRPALLALALALNVGAENGVYAAWLLQAVRNSPSLKGLAPLLSTFRSEDGPADISGLVDFVVAMGQRSSPERVQRLLALADQHTASSSTAALWAAYGLRGLGQFDEAVALFDRLVEEFGDRNDLYRTQAAISLAMGHRAVQALARAAELDEVSRRRVVGYVDYRHGIIEGRASRMATRVASLKGRRYQLELSGEWLVAKHLEGGATQADIDDVRIQADGVGHVGAQVQARRVELESNLYDDARCDRLLAEIEAINGADRRPLASWVMSLAMRAWATGRREFLDKAEALAGVADSHPGTGWVPVGVLLAYLGRPMSLYPGEWLDDYADVADRWMGHLHRIKGRAWARAAAGADDVDTP
jgi:tetratricopeptide (TPR) repeat protein